MINFEPYFDDNLKNPPYPPYHEGMDLEDYFINFYFSNKKEFDETGYIFIPVKWTAIYNLRGDLCDSLQQNLLGLDQSKKYFTVSQHDDAPYQKLPINTLKFSAGGNIKNTIPIPLICSKIKDVPNTKKDVFCSFVGSITQNIGHMGSLSHSIRMKMLDVLVNDSKYILKPKHWSPDIKEDRQKLFLDVTSRSKFCLSPRGYGSSSFRMYEAMQLKSVPVYIYHEKPFLPFENDLEWGKIAILIDYSKIEKINDILCSIDDKKYEEILSYTDRIYDDYFTLNGMSKNILKTLKNEKNIICNS